MNCVRALALSGAIGLVATACGSGGSSTVTNAPPTTASTTAAAASHCPAGDGLTGTVNDHGARPIVGAGAAVEAGDFYFSPTCATGATAGTVTLTVHNGGQALHNVSIPDQGIDTDVAPGQNVTVSIKVGTTPVPYFCKFHRTSGMVGAVLPSGG